MGTKLVAAIARRLRRIVVWVEDLFWRSVDGMAGNGRSGGNDVLRKAAFIFDNDLSSKVVDRSKV